MAWLKIRKAPIQKGAPERRETSDNLWYKCVACLEIIYHSDFKRNQYVCTSCGHHFPITPHERLDRFFDDGQFSELFGDLKSTNPLRFKDTKDYSERLAASFAKTGRTSAVLAAQGNLLGSKIFVGVFDFRFLGGSMGAVEGEKLARLFRMGAEQGVPVVVFSASGGARMQEGIVSLMQMAKTCAGLSAMRNAGVPLISVLTNPTTGGVAASYAMLGDVNIAEPGALIGFAGPRVIQQTIGQSLPKGFQTSEYLLQHGMLDMICHRDALRDQLAQIIRILSHSL